MPFSSFFPLTRLVSIARLSLRKFKEDQCLLRASALTFYSLLSIVPLLAMVFGIAKGFGLEKHLETLLIQKFQGQREVLQWLLHFSHSLLATVKGGLIAGGGVLLLFWTVIRLLTNIESALNHIWKVPRGRPFGRRVSDYLSIMLLCPILVVFAAGLTVFLASQIHLVTTRISWLAGISPFLLFALKGLPYFLVWVLLLFTYHFIPYTRVSFRASAGAALLAAVVYQLLQKGYIVLQIGITHYHAIYGSFAAFPLLLIWLQISWIVVLGGAEVSYTIDHGEERIRNRIERLGPGPDF